MYVKCMYVSFETVCVCVCVCVYCIDCGCCTSFVVVVGFAVQTSSSFVVVIGIGGEEGMA